MVCKKVVGICFVLLNDKIVYDKVWKIDDNFVYLKRD